MDSCIVAAIIPPCFGTPPKRNVHVDCYLAKLLSPSSVRKRIEQLHASRREMPDIARYQNQVIQKRRGRDLLVERILGMRHAQPTPYLSRIGVERQDAVTVLGKKRT